MAKEESLIMPNNTDEITISRAKLDSITVYDVTEEELEIIERGSPSSNYLNFSVALLSIFISFLISLLSTKIESDKTYTFFMVVTVVSLIIGIFLLYLWWRTYDSTKAVFKKIRSRKSVDAIVDAVELGHVNEMNQQENNQ
jgi:hypothetical protein